jgi:hypothetical protein
VAVAGKERKEHLLAEVLHLLAHVTSTGETVPAGQQGPRHPRLDDRRQQGDQPGQGRRIAGQGSLHQTGGVLGAHVLMEL